MEKVLDLYKRHSKPLESFAIDIEKIADMVSGTCLIPSDESNCVICKEGEAIKIFRLAEEESICGDVVQIYKKLVDEAVTSFSNSSDFDEYCIRILSQALSNLPRKQSKQVEVYIFQKMQEKRSRNGGRITEIFEAVPEEMTVER